MFPLKYSKSSFESMNVCLAPSNWENYSSFSLGKCAAKQQSRLWHVRIAFKAVFGRRFQSATSTQKRKCQLFVISGTQYSCCCGPFYDYWLNQLQWLRETCPVIQAEHLDLPVYRSHNFDPWRSVEIGAGGAEDAPSSVPAMFWETRASICPSQ